eukprot:9482266-Pyramimonas_sp.AAC.1
MSATDRRTDQTGAVEWVGAGVPWHSVGVPWHSVVCWGSLAQCWGALAKSCRLSKGLGRTSCVTSATTGGGWGTPATTGGGWGTPATHTTPRSPPPSPPTGLSLLSSPVVQSCAPYSDPVNSVMHPLPCEP